MSGIGNTRPNLHFFQYIYTELHGKEAERLKQKISNVFQAKSSTGEPSRLATQRCLTLQGSSTPTTTRCWPARCQWFQRGHGATAAAPGGRGRPTSALSAGSASPSRSSTRPPSRWRRPTTRRRRRRCRTRRTWGWRSLSGRCATATTSRTSKNQASAAGPASPSTSGASRTGGWWRTPTSPSAGPWWPRRAHSAQPLANVDFALLRNHCWWWNHTWEHSMIVVNSSAIVDTRTSFYSRLLSESASSGHLDFSTWRQIVL